MNESKIIETKNRRIFEDKIVYKDGRVEEFEYGITEIAEEAYKDKRNIVSVILPKSVTKIGKSAFYACSCLNDIELQEGVTEIGERAFTFCDKLTSVTIPNGVSIIGKCPERKMLFAFFLVSSCG